MKISRSVILVTGGVSGLGLATVSLLIEKGAKVAIADINDEGGQKLAGELGSNALYIHCDICDATSVSHAVVAAQSLGSLAGLVHCAGVASARRVVGRDNVPWPIENFAQTLKVNLLGSFLVSSEVAAAMMKADKPDGERGVIILTSSIAAHEGQLGQAAYAASKGGVEAMILPMTRELAQFGIRIAGIAPGVFQTPMMAGMKTDLQTALAAQVPYPKRLGFPSEFAALAVQILENEYLNGTVIRLDGGIRMQ